MNKKHSKIYALGIVAHPDDETFMFGGTSLMFAQQGKLTAAIIATRGESGHDRLNRNLTKKQMAKEREVELKNAGKIVKLKFIQFLNYPDGGLDQANPRTLIPELTRSIEQHTPEIILTFGREGITGHRDHIAIHKAALAAVKKSAHKPREIWMAAMPTSRMKSFHKELAARKVHHSHFQKIKLKGVPDAKLLKINIKKFSKQKLSAIKAHKSQYVPSTRMKDFLTQEQFEVLKIKP